jgi:hypothetical protein
MLVMQYCGECIPNEVRDSPWNRNVTIPKKALVIAGSISNAQQRTMKFETSGYFSYHPEMLTNLTVNLGKKALLSFLYNEDRPIMALDTWHGNNDTARYAQQMTGHHYTFNVLAIDEATDKEIQWRGDEKLYGTPVYIIGRANISLREFDPDGSTVLFDIPRIN